MDNWFAPARFALLAACLIAASFPRVLAGLETFFFRDFAIFSYPLAVYHKDCFWRGELPSWNPYNDCGLPFLAQWNAMALYPFSLIYLFLPLPWSLNFFCLAHMFLAALGMYFLARQWTRSDFAAAAAGIGFILNGLFLSCLKWPNNAAALGLMPWVVLTVQKALAGSWRDLGVAALAGGIQMLSGAPEIILLTWIFCALLLVQCRFTFWRSATRFALLALLAGGLAAAQLLPFLRLLAASQRVENFAASEWSMPPWGIANFFVPLFRTFPSYHGVPAQPGQYWISTYYVSLPLVVLACFALLAHWRADSPGGQAIRATSSLSPGVLWCGLILVSWIALGERAWLYKWLRQFIPGMGMVRYPIKFVVLAAFILPLLGAIGLAKILKMRAPKRMASAVIALAGAALLVIFGLVLNAEINPVPYAIAPMVSRNGIGRALFLILGTAFIVSWVRCGSGLKWISAAGFLLTIALDALTHAPWQNPSVPASVYLREAVAFPETVALGRSRAMISPEAAARVDHLKLDDPAEDVMASRRSLYCNVNLLERIPKVDGFFALYPRHAAELQEAVYFRGTNNPPGGLLDFLAVRYLSAPGSWSEWLRRESALPYISSPQKAVYATNALEQILNPAFDPRAVAYLSRPLEAGEISPVAVSDIDWASERIAFQARTDQAGLVVLSQTHDPAWHATIDGQPAPIQRVNHAFQGILLPPGAHAVALVYRDTALRVGGIISGFTAVAVSLLVTVGGRRPG